MTATSVPRRSTSKVGELVLRIEEDITLGKISVGTWLRQSDLEKVYECTRLGLREALDRLSEKGLVHLESNRGYRVVDVDEQKLTEILKVRAVLEVAAAEETYDKFTAASLRQLKTLAKSFERMVAEGSVVEQEQANRLFHASMLHPCANSELVDLIFELRNRTPVTSNRRKNTATRLKQACEEHHKIIALLDKRDLQGLRAMMKQHVLGDLLTKPTKS